MEGDINNAAEKCTKEQRIRHKEQTIENININPNYVIQLCTQIYRGERNIQAAKRASINTADRLDTLTHQAWRQAQGKHGHTISQDQRNK